MIMPYDFFKTLKINPNLHYAYTLIQIKKVFKLIYNKNIDASLNISTQDLADY
jgi:hypothetical protein